MEKQNQKYHIKRRNNSLTRYFQLPFVHIPLGTPVHQARTAMPIDHTEITKIKATELKNYECSI